MTSTSFSTLSLDEPLQRALRDSGYSIPTPIQAQAIPHLLEGRDLLGCAKTGTGKTAAFALPILQHLAKRKGGGIRTLVLVPTRELASQVAESFRTYGAHLNLSVLVIYGGVSQGAQVRSLQRGVDIVVATPGRLVDLMNQGHVKLGNVEVLVLDEADHMLDLGFIPDVRRIIKAVPAKRQTLLFSATMPPAIEDLAHGMLRNPVKVMVTPPATTVELVDQSVHFVSRNDKPDFLSRILSQPAVESALVFARTKRGADRVAKKLASDGIPAGAIHGNKAQGARERTLRAFKDGSVRVLVATDIAARGLDVTGISHVINYELPHVPETYVHRIGRTGRAGATGIAIALCSEDERSLLRDIERTTRCPIRVALAADVPKGAPRDPRPMPDEPRYRDPRAVKSRSHSQRTSAPRSATPRAQAPRADRASQSDAQRFAARGTRPAAAVPGRSDSPAVAQGSRDRGPRDNAAASQAPPDRGRGRHAADPRREERTRGTRSHSQAAAAAPARSRAAAPVVFGRPFLRAAPGLRIADDAAPLRRAARRSDASINGDT